MPSLPRILNATPTDIAGTGKVYSGTRKAGFLPTHLENGLTSEVRGLATQYAKGAADAGESLILEHPENVLALGTQHKHADRVKAVAMTVELVKIVKPIAKELFVGIWMTPPALWSWNDSLEDLYIANKDMRPLIDLMPALIVGDYPYYEYGIDVWREQNGEIVRNARKAVPGKPVLQIISPVWQYGPASNRTNPVSLPLPEWFFREQLQFSLHPDNPVPMADGAVLWTGQEEVAPNLVKVIQSFQ